MMFVFVWLKLGSTYIFCYNRNIFTKVIMTSLLQYGGLSKFNLTSNLLSFGVSGMSNFQGAKIGVAMN